MGKTVVLTGGNGPERTQIIKKYIDSKLCDGRVVIYDYTYGLISYNKFENVDYFCVDTCLAYIEKLPSSAALVSAIAQGFNASTRVLSPISAPLPNDFLPVPKTTR